MGRIEVSAEVLRIANLYCTRDGSFKSKDQKRVTATEYILIDPCPGGGLNVIATDCAVACIQHDPDGSADHPYTLSIDKPLSDRLKGETTRERTVIIKDDGLRVMGDGGRIYKAERNAEYVVRDAQVHDQVGTGWPPDDRYIVTYPNWHRIVPNKATLADMTEGFPGVISTRYLHLIGRMYSDWNEHREVRLLHDGTNVIALFPWRPDMMLIIAPMGCGPFDTREAASNLAELTSGDDL